MKWSYTYHTRFGTYAADTFADRAYRQESRSWQMRYMQSLNPVGKALGRAFGQGQYSNKEWFRMLHGFGRVRRVRYDDGSVLVIALLVALIVAGLGLTAMWLGSSGTKISSNMLRRQEALYAAETGVERARHILGTVVNASTLLDGSLCVGAGDDPTGKGRVLCDNSTPLENLSVVATGTTTHGEVVGAGKNAQYTIYVRNDSAEWAWCNGVVEAGETADDGNCDGVSGAETDLWRATNDQDGRLAVRAEGLGGDGLAYVALELTIYRQGAASTVPEYTQEGGNPQGSNSHAVNMVVP